MPGNDLPAESWVPALPPDVRFRRLRGKMLLARQDDGVELNEVGASIFRLIDGDTGVASIAAAISSEYDIDGQTALTDVQEFLAQLAELGILVRDW